MISSDLICEFYSFDILYIRYVVISTIIFVSEPRVLLTKGRKLPDGQRTVSSFPFILVPVVWCIEELNKTSNTPTMIQILILDLSPTFL